MPDIFNILKSLGNVDITRYSDSEILTPQNIVSDMVDLLPQEVFNPDTTFLDPAVKSGRFLKEIYNRLFNSPLLSYMNEKERREHILHNQLFGLATSPTAATLSRAMLYDTAVYRGNIVYADNYIARVIKSKGQDIKKIIEGAFEKDMTFDVVIGNPPYQNSRQSIYPLFISNAIDLNPKYIVMITKNNWMVGNTIKSIRDKMIEFGIASVINYPMPFEIFSNVSVNTAIIFLTPKVESTNLTEIRKGKVVQQFRAKLIPGKNVYTNKYSVGITDKTFSSKRFNTRFRNEMGYGIATTGRIGKTGKGVFLNFTNAKVKDDDIQVIFQEKQKNRIYYVSKSELPAGADLVSKYKICCGRILHRNENVITNIIGVKPGQITSQTWVTLYYSENVDEVTKALSYISTKLFRFLVRLALQSDGQTTCTSQCFSLVPDQDFSSNSDIDWSQTVADIDKQLYKKYNLSQEEIDYIEQTINPYD